MKEVKTIALPDGMEKLACIEVLNDSGRDPLEKLNECINKFNQISKTISAETGQKNEIEKIEEMKDLIDNFKSLCNKISSIFLNKKISIFPPKSDLLDLDTTPNDKWLFADKTFLENKKRDDFQEKLQKLKEGTLSVMNEYLDSQLTDKIYLNQTNNIVEEFDGI